MISERKISSFLKRRHKLAIGEKTAGDLKATLNNVPKLKIKALGRSYKSGRKKTVNISVSDFIK